MKVPLGLWYFMKVVFWVTISYEGTIQGYDSLWRYPLGLGFREDSWEMNYTGFRFHQNIQTTKFSRNFIIFKKAECDKLGLRRVLRTRVIVSGITYSGNSAGYYLLG